MKIGFVGMTHLGLISAYAASIKGFDVVAIDTHQTDAVTGEQGFGGIIYGFDFADLRDCELVFITQDVDNPENEKRAEYLFGRASVYAEQTPIIIMSQISIGATRSLARMHAGPTFYQLDTLRTGDAVQRAMRPEMLTIGMSDSDVILPKAYVDYLVAFNAPINLVSYEEAEIAKSMINVYLAAQVAATNVGAAVCGKHVARWGVIKRTLHADHRIGNLAYLEPGPGYEGSHLVRDVRRIMGEFDGFQPFMDGLLDSKDGVK